MLTANASFLRLAAAAAVCLPASPVGAQSAPNPLTLEVAGVRLGMSPAETKAAMKSFDATASITEPMNTPNFSTVGNQIWSSNFAIVALSQDFEKFPNRDDEPNYKNCLAHSSHTYPEDSDREKCVINTHSTFTALLRSKIQAPRVTVAWFSAVPGKEKVIAISSSTVFVGSVPTVEAVTEKLLSKYAFALTDKRQVYDTTQLSWVFDSRNRLAARSQINHQISGLVDSNERLFTCSLEFAVPYGRSYDTGLCPSAVLPGQFYSGEGIYLTAEVNGGATMRNGVLALGESPSEQNPLLAKTVNISLYDSSALGQYSGQAKAYLKAKQNDAATGGAQGHGTVPTNF